MSSDEDDASRCNRLSTEWKQTGSGNGQGTVGGIELAMQSVAITCQSVDLELKPELLLKLKLGVWLDGAGARGTLLDGVADMHAACRMPRA